MSTSFIHGPIAVIVCAITQLDPVRIGPDIVIVTVSCDGDVSLRRQAYQLRLRVVTEAITMYERELGIPATDPLTRSPERLVEMVLLAFPKLAGNPAAGTR